MVDNTILIQNTVLAAMVWIPVACPRLAQTTSMLGVVGFFQCCICTMWTV